MAESARRLCEQSLFENQLSTISGILAHHGITWSLVGGFGIKAYLGEKAEVRRHNGTICDLDGIILGPNEQTVAYALNEVKKTRFACPFPEIGLKSVEFQDHPSRFTFPPFINSLRRNSSGNTFLTYNEIEEEIPTETLTLQTRVLNGIEFPVFPAKTILFLYLIRGSIMKKKDDGKLQKLEEYIVKNWDENPEDRYYRPYLRFAERVRERYPLMVATYNAFWHLDDLLGNHLSGRQGLFFSAADLIHKQT